MFYDASAMQRGAVCPYQALPPEEVVRRRALKKRYPPAGVNLNVYYNIDDQMLAVVLGIGTVLVHSRCGTLYWFSFEVQAFINANGDLYLSYFSNELDSPSTGAAAPIDVQIPPDVSQWPADVLRLGYFRRHAVDQIAQAQQGNSLLELFAAQPNPLMNANITMQDLVGLSVAAGFQVAQMPPPTAVAAPTTASSTTPFRMPQGTAPHATPRPVIGSASTIGQSTSSTSLTPPRAQQQQQQGIVQLPLVTPHMQQQAARPTLSTSPTMSVTPSMNAFLDQLAAATATTETQTVKNEPGVSSPTLSSHARAPQYAYFDLNRSDDTQAPTIAVRAVDLTRANLPRLQAILAGTNDPNPPGLSSTALAVAQNALRSGAEQRSSITGDVSIPVQGPAVVRTALTFGNASIALTTTIAGTSTSSAVTTATATLPAGVASDLMTFLQGLQTRQTVLENCFAQLTPNLAHGLISSVSSLAQTHRAAIASTVAIASSTTSSTSTLPFPTLGLPPTAGLASPRDSAAPSDRAQRASTSTQMDVGTDDDVTTGWDDDMARGNAPTAHSTGIVDSVKKRKSTDSGTEAQAKAARRPSVKDVLDTSVSDRVRVHPRKAAAAGQDATKQVASYEHSKSTRDDRPTPQRAALPSLAESASESKKSSKSSTSKPKTKQTWTVTTPSSSPGRPDSPIKVRIKRTRPIWQLPFGNSGAGSSSASVSIAVTTGSSQSTQDKSSSSTTGIATSSTANLSTSTSTSAARPAPAPASARPAPIPPVDDDVDTPGSNVASHVSGTLSSSSSSSSLSSDSSLALLEEKEKGKKQSATTKPKPKPRISKKEMKVAVETKKKTKASISKQQPCEPVTTDTSPQQQSTVASSTSTQKAKKTRPPPSEPEIDTNEINEAVVNQVGEVTMARLPDTYRTQFRHLVQDLLDRIEEDQFEEHIVLRLRLTDIDPDVYSVRRPFRRDLLRSEYNAYLHLLQHREEYGFQKVKFTRRIADMCNSRYINDPLMLFKNLCVHVPELRGYERRIVRCVGREELILDVRGAVPAWEFLTAFGEYHQQLVHRLPRLVAFGLTQESQLYLHTVSTHLLTRATRFEHIYVAVVYDDIPRTHTPLAGPVATLQFGIADEDLYKDEAVVDPAYLCFEPADDIRNRYLERLSGTQYLGAAFRSKRDHYEPIPFLYYALQMADATKTVQHKTEFLQHVTETPDL